MTRSVFREISTTNYRFYYEMSPSGEACLEVLRGRGAFMEGSKCQKYYVITSFGLSRSVCDLLSKESGMLFGGLQRLPSFRSD